MNITRNYARDRGRDHAWRRRRRDDVARGAQPECRPAGRRSPTPGAARAGWWHGTCL